MLFGAYSLISFYVPANGIELIVLPLHDGQTLPSVLPKNDAHQKHWLHSANWTCFEILAAFVIGPSSAIMVVVVVVIVFNYTSPKFHKLVFSDYRQLYAFKEINKYVFIVIPKLLSDSISDTWIHGRTKVANIKMLRCEWQIQQFRHYWEGRWILFYFLGHDIFYEWKAW